MPNHKSAKKRIIKTQSALKSTALVSVYSHVHQEVEAAITAGDKAAADQALRDAQPEIMRGVSRGVLHKNAASENVSLVSTRKGISSVTLTRHYDV